MLLIIITLFFALPVFPSYKGFLVAFVISLILFPTIMYLQNKDDKEQETYYQRQKDEYDEYMRIERMKMQDTGRCVNCNSLLDPNLPYCPNCNFRVEDYA